MTRPAPSCFTQDNTRADGFSGHEIYAQMTGGPGTGSAQAAANAATALERGYAGIEQRLKKVGETLGEAWTGASADAAQAAANPINQAMIQMQDALRQADHSLSNQVYQFNYNKGQLKNMPASKPETGFWDDVSPWDTDTEDAVNSYNSEESHNRKVYSEFQSASNTNRGELPKQFPGVTADTLNVEVINTGSGNGENNTTNVSNTGRPSGNPGSPNTTGSPQGPTGTTWTPPGSTTGDQTTTSGVSGGDDGRVGGPGRPGDLGGPGGGKPPAGTVIDRPPNTGIPPIGVPGGPGLGGPGGTGGGRGGGGAGGKFGTGGGGGGAGGKVGGGGLGGVGSGTGSSGNAGQQPGGKSGVFGAMGESGPNAGARGGAAGAGGRAGAAGMGGMGGQGQKGQGEDDLEHKSADYLITEENTNEIIGDMPMVAPPTIGG
ncbi:hypothetical protein ACWGE0_42715 [Lentzea sp. NPDC054927]